MSVSAVARNFHGIIKMPGTPVMAPPVLKLINRGARLAKSLAGLTPFAAMFTEMVAMAAEERAWWHWVPPARLHLSSGHRVRGQLGGGFRGATSGARARRDSEADEPESGKAREAEAKPEIELDHAAAEARRRSIELL